MRRLFAMIGLALTLLACSSSSSGPAPASRTIITGDHKCTQSSPGANPKCDDGEVFPQLCGNSKPPCWSFGTAGDGSQAGLCVDCCAPGTATASCEPIPCKSANDCPFSSSACNGGFCSAN